MVITMKLYIKYMVSLRCKMVVRQEIEKLGISNAVVNLGMVEILTQISEEQQQILKKNLLNFGLELRDDKKSILIEKIKNVYTEMIHHSDSLSKENFSEYISRKLRYDYSYLANIFSEVKGITLQHFIIINKMAAFKKNCR